MNIYQEIAKVDIIDDGLEFAESWLETCGKPTSETEFIIKRLCETVILLNYQNCETKH